jgi:2-deoxy-D-gluconate 3-dehydrogenase
LQRNKENLETYNAVKAVGRSVEIAVCDLSDDKAVKGLTKHVTSSKEDGGLGHSIDILVNCGGIQRR